MERYLHDMSKSVKYSHMTKAVHNVDFHLHAGCEIYVLLQGDVRYFVEKTVYPLQYGDLIITNEQEIHKPSFNSDELYERVTIEFNPNMAKAFATSDYNPLACFYDRNNGKGNKLSLTSKEMSQILELFKKYESIDRINADGAAVLKLACIMEILVAINNIYYRRTHEHHELDIHHKLTPILDYIELHLHEPLTLELLQNRFFISKYHLLRVFKQYTGSTVHEYIVTKRIAMAKKYLSEGMSVLDASLRCGFNDYTSFLRMFKKKIGVPPKEYQQGARLGQSAPRDR
ncbi:AraC family transcriptional regulator [Paenibacillus sp. HB172176]|uniref:AraC family transcriptional regulator n=1 Tax=Paenibacillus sp. HB172176 TaxID=2493690 RepID=UPI00143B7B5A|nr:AraC family transcriptional regulator [Paenibacillus sp. HB172176]